MTLSHEVECDEAYVIAGHKGHPEVLKTKGRQGRRRRLKGPCGRGTLAKERPPVFGMMQRGGQVVIKLLANVQQKTVVYPVPADNVSRPRRYRLRRVNQPVMSPPNRFSTPRSTLLPYI